MAKFEVWLETPPFRDDYQLAAVDPEYLMMSVKPKQFLHIDQSECIICEGCVDICPWKCIHFLSLDAIDDAHGVSHPSESADNQGFFVVDESECTRCQLCIDRCPTNVISIGKFEGSVTATAMNSGLVDQAPWDVDSGARDFKNGYTYGMRF